MKIVNLEPGEDPGAGMQRVCIEFSATKTVAVPADWGPSDLVDALRTQTVALLAEPEKLDLVGDQIDATLSFEMREATYNEDGELMYGEVDPIVQLHNDIRRQNKE
jgi:hypothetical protein